MPHIDLPQSLRRRITSVDLRLGYPGQISLRSPWTGNSQLLNRGYQRWEATAEIAPSGKPILPRHEDEWGPIEAFFAALNGRQNTFDLPHRRPAADISGTFRFQASRTVDEVLQHRLPSQPGADFSVGQMLNADNRSYMVVRILPQRWIVLNPQRVIGTAVDVTASTTIRVRAASSEGINMPLQAFRPGPWSINCDEA